MMSLLIYFLFFILQKKRKNFKLNSQLSTKFLLFEFSKYQISTHHHHTMSNQLYNIIWKWTLYSFFSTLLRSRVVVVFISSLYNISKNENWTYSQSKVEHHRYTYDMLYFYVILGFHYNHLTNSSNCYGLFEWWSWVLSLSGGVKFEYELILFLLWVV